MSTDDQNEANHQDSKTSAQDIPPHAREDAHSSTPVEMKSLQTDSTIGSTLAQHETHRSNSGTQMPHPTMRTNTTTALQSAENPPPPPLPNTPSPRLDRTVSTAIGPSSDTPAPIAKDSAPAGPTLMLNLLLLNGARHPFNLDAVYLAKRNVQAQGNDPFNLSVYKVKELILREWRSEWESKPSSPSAIRLIHLGKVLDDKTAFKGM